MNPFTQTSAILVTCGRGVAPFLARELRALGFSIRTQHDTGIETEGTAADAMRLNLHIRTGQRVLWELARFRAMRPNALYRHINEQPWEELIPADGYVTVRSSVHLPAIRDPRFATLTGKDAIVDRIRDRTGRRPDSGNELRGASVFLYGTPDTCIVYLDTSGEPLSRRGYRRLPMDAPMHEALAAAVILATGWDGACPFVNPMCGSGTLAIEAALLASARAPGLTRSAFAFMHLLGYDAALWSRLRADAQAQVRTGGIPAILAGDIRREAVDAARRNAQQAGVAGLIHFQACDFADTPAPPGGAVIVMNPEYGERMGRVRELEPVYARIGDFLKQRCQGSTGFVFTGNPDLGKKIGLRPAQRIPFFNSRIECRLLRFDLYEGSRRT